jgi:hypothetical protein
MKFTKAVNFIFCSIKFTGLSFTGSEMAQPVILMFGDINMGLPEMLDPNVGVYAIKLVNIVRERRLLGDWYL